MATEGPLIHDGGQCTAGTNMGSGASLSGYNGTGQFLGVVISGGRAVVPDTTGGAVIYGVLLNQPSSGQAADVGLVGSTKVMAGGTISAGYDLMTNASGQAVSATSTNHRFGIAIEGGTSGTLVTALIGTAGNRTA